MSSVARESNALCSPLCHEKSHLHVEQGIIPNVSTKILYSSSYHNRPASLVPWSPCNVCIHKSDDFSFVMACCGHLCLNHCKYKGGKPRKCLLFGSSVK